MRSRSAQLTLTLVCLIFGALLMIQFRTQGKLAKSQVGDSTTDQYAMISNLYDANVELRREAEKLAAQQDEYQRSLRQSDLTDMATEVNQLRVFTGQSEVSGPGVELQVAAALRSVDVQDLINELRNAGAEAIAVNGQRITAASAVTSNGDQVVLDNVLLGPPFAFEAIGQPDTLDRALGRKGGMVSYLRTTYPAAAITLTKQALLTLPVYRGPYQLVNAQPAR